MELPKQVTVAIIKPDAIKAGLVDEIIQKVLSSRGGVLPYETDGDACRLAYGYKFWILVSLRVFRAKRQYFKLPKSRLGFCEETRNYAKRKRKRSQIFFFLLFFLF